MNELQHFLGGYFHQDWLLEADEPNAMISLFLKSQPERTTTQHIAEQIRRFLNEYREDEVVERKLFEHLGCYYCPSADGLRATDWLAQLAARFEQY